MAIKLERAAQVRPSQIAQAQGDSSHPPTPRERIRASINQAMEASAVLENVIAATLGPVDGDPAPNTSIIADEDNLMVHIEVLNRATARTISLAYQLSKGLI
jgi:hypothetical protein